MEAFLFILLASFIDPVRWVICVLSAWFVPNYPGSLAVGVGATVGLFAMLVPHVSGPSLLAGGIASAAIVSAFYFWRQSRLKKKVQAST
ncbi:MAG: hypothetical protein ACREPQ_12250 [Rhodanobacter sp.]